MLKTPRMESQEPGNKRKSRTDSRGNHFKLQQQQQQRDGKMIKELKHDPVQFLNDTELTDGYCNAQLQSSCSCYRFVNSGKKTYSCLLKHFSRSDGSCDYNEAITYFKSCRECTRRLVEPGEKDKFLIAQFGKCIKEKIEANDGSIQFKMDYKLPLDIVVCKTAWAAAYGFSVYKLQECSTAIKASATYNPTLLKRKRWNDDYIHDFSFKETEEMMADNALEPGAYFDNNSMHCSFFS